MKLTSKQSTDAISRPSMPRRFDANRSLSQHSGFQVMAAITRLLPLYKLRHPCVDQEWLNIRIPAWNYPKACFVQGMQQLLDESATDSRDLRYRFLALGDMVRRKHDQAVCTPLQRSCSHEKQAGSTTTNKVRRRLAAWEVVLLSTLLWQCV